jgi:hypothetical protein
VHAASYPPARHIAERITWLIDSSPQAYSGDGAAPRPGADVIEHIVTVAFWSSLLHEEGHAPSITLAYVPPSDDALTFAQPLDFEPHVLAHLAPSVERPGIHLGVWHLDGALRVWGVTRRLPYWCFVLEVAAPGLLVVKYRRPDSTVKLANVAVLEGAHAKMIEPQSAVITDAPPALQPLLEFYASAGGRAGDDVLVRTAISMRQHGRGGTLLVIPHTAEDWRSSFAQPLAYAASAPYSEVDRLLELRRNSDTHEAEREVREAISALAGLTAVDGATLVTDRFALLAYGVKIRAGKVGRALERVLITEPVEGSEPRELDIAQLGGTRHLSAAQFAADHPDSIAMVASQDGRFTVFVWSRAMGLVHGHRLESLLL